MKSQGYKGLEWDRHPGGFNILDVMVEVLRNKMSSGIKYLGTMVRYASIFYPWFLQRFLTYCGTGS
jgi:hypothetical protein